MEITETSRQKSRKAIHRCKGGIATSVATRGMAAGATTPTVAMATTGRRRRAASASESGRRAGMATIATAETAESAARPTAATAMDGTRSSLLAAARPGALPSCGQGHATSTSGGVRLWWMLLEVEAAVRRSAAPSRAPGRTTAAETR